MAKKVNKEFENSCDRIMVQCRTQVNPDNVRRESIDGIEHIIVSSATLPDDIVMNGGLYPAAEIEKSFESLNLTLAPVEHPNVNGEFISASDPRAIHNFHAGAFNYNARRKDGRVWIDKYINVVEANKSDRGKRLLDRINELEQNQNPRHIHTSVGVFLEPQQLDEPKTNAAGTEYTWIASKMVFDHDAILLDSVGAAQPSQGVGIAVNNKGEKCKVNTFILPPKPVVNESLNELQESVTAALDSAAINVDWIVDLYPDKVIFYTDDLHYEVPYVVDDQGIVTIVGIPVPVDKNVTYTLKTTSKKGDKVRDKMLDALAAGGVTVNAEIPDDDLLIKYNELLSKPAPTEDIASIVTNAVKDSTKALVERIDVLQAKIDSADNEELERLADIVGNSDKFPGLGVDDAKKIGVNALQAMANSLTPAFGVSPVNNLIGGDDMYSAPSEMPN